MNRVSLVNRGASFLFWIGIVLVFVPFLPAPCIAADWGKSPLTGEPQGFGLGFSPPVGDFDRAQKESSFTAYPLKMDMHPPNLRYGKIPMLNIPVSPTDYEKLKARDAIFSDLFGKDRTKLQSSEQRKHWICWNNRVSGLMYARFKQSAQKLFKNSPPLHCRVGYTVISDGSVCNVRVIEPSTNAAYDSMVLRAVTSIEHNPALRFPSSWKSPVIDRTATFTWNYSSNALFGGNPVGIVEEEPMYYFGPRPGVESSVRPEKSWRAPADQNRR